MTNTHRAVYTWPLETMNGPEGQKEINIPTHVGTGHAAGNDQHTCRVWLNQEGPTWCRAGTQECWDRMTGQVIPGRAQYIQQVSNVRAMTKQDQQQYLWELWRAAVDTSDERQKEHDELTRKMTTASEEIKRLHQERIIIENTMDKLEDQDG